MILLPDDLRAVLRANAMCHDAALRDGLAEPDFRPVLKLFNPMGAATWLATELDEDGDTLFGLADLGFGCPELGSFSLAEIASVRLPFGLAIERDCAFATAHPLSVWAAWARRSGSILGAQAMLWRLGPDADEAPAAPELPPS
ncbi:hypothetical protein ABIC78_003807 [Novosphingobium sp. 1529]|uniref:DUF2958 domain-containing protein n=1 Tax=Novosphingobium sp. 1529 TaxID=3156424 RepID=UPI00339078B3